MVRAILIVVGIIILTNAGVAAIRYLLHDIIFTTADGQSLKEFEDDIQRRIDFSLEVQDRLRWEREHEFVDRVYFPDWLLNK